MLDRFGEYDKLQFQVLIAKALVTESLILHSLGRETDAILACDYIDARFGECEDSELQANSTMALFNKACFYAMKKDIKASIETLELWSKRRGGMDIDKIKNDPDFKGIFKNKVFQNFLKRYSFSS